SYDCHLWIFFHVGSRLIYIMPYVSPLKIRLTEVLGSNHLYTRHVCIPLASNRKSITRASIAVRRSLTMWRLLNGQQSIMWPPPPAPVILPPMAPALRASA